MPRKFHVDIVVPLRAHSHQHANDVLRRLEKMAALDDVHVIVTDNSEQSIQRWLAANCSTLGVLFLANRWEAALDSNRKMLNLQEAFEHIESEFVIVLDDDSTLSADALHEILISLENSGHVRTSVHFKHIDLFNAIDLCGLFVVNITCRDKQFWGMQAMTRDSAKSLRDVSVKTVFDELTIYRHLVEKNVRTTYLDHVCIVSHCKRSAREFLEQRIRYGYENFAYPIRSAAFLSIYPLLFFSFFAAGSCGAYELIATLWSAATFLSLLGWFRSRRGHRHHYMINAAAPVWLTVQATFSWISIVALIIGGVRFSRVRLRRAA